MPQMPVWQAYIEGQRALEGSWEHRSHIRSGTIRRDRGLNIEKSNTCSVLGGKPVKTALGFGEALSGQRSQTTLSIVVLLTVACTSNPDSLFKYAFQFSVYDLASMFYGCLP